jgi:hypothetical protein
MQSAAYFMKNDISSIICQLCTGIAPPPEPPTKAVHSGQIKQIIGGDNSRGIPRSRSCVRARKRLLDQCGEFEVPIIIAASWFRNFKFKTALES